MKNMKKLVALFAATVMTMSFGVSAFAATVETEVEGRGDTSSSFNLVFAAPTPETDIEQMTMIAYLVPDTTTLETWEAYDGSQTIVAINQVGGDVGFGTVPVDVTKLEAGNAIAVAIGGTDVGEVAKYLVTYSTAPQIVSYAVTYELDGGTPTGNPEESNSEETIAEFFARATAKPEKDGFTFLHWSKTADGEAINTSSPEKMSTLLDEGSTTQVTLYAVYEAQINAICVTFMNGDEVVDTVDTVDGKAVLTSKVPTLAADDGYATKNYKFVEWVTEDGTPVTAETPINANTTVYAKFESNYVQGDVTGDGYVRANDRMFIHNYITSNSVTNADKVGVPVSKYFTKKTGDVTGDNYVRANDRMFIHNYITSNSVTNADKVGIKLYVINK